MFRTALTADSARPDGGTIFGNLGLGRLDDAGIPWHVLARYLDPIPPEDLNGVAAVLSLGHITFDAETVAAADDLELIARFGAGYETIDVEACTHAGVAVTNTSGAIRRPLALASLTMLLAVGHKLRMKDHITRTGRWDEREDFRGAAFDGKTVGIVGFGSVGSELAKLLAPLGMTVLGTNRSGHSRAADALGVRMVELDDLLRQSDYVVVTASLNASSRHLVDAGKLALMKQSAFIVNMGRGALIDQEALRTALRDGKISGAGLDVFDPEPIAADDELLSFDNVTLAPHSLNWTDDFTRAVSSSALGAIIEVAHGRRPETTLNPEVFDTEAFRAKQRRRLD
ncbi:NAD(P)-dependent oxidoreductase [Spelaeicoccus albus]|uniref:Phosphoglycerate dehydrogenase-like enzyme n=2 Tax=Spelaeicoccus albus TaxID=1280376 RepID=A0A7Z0AAE1_9MICO|nr:D-isomer specific 2-hydroxyacid dehydrogenase family protein [Spelaeicoccus albus]NYI67247.1 phosphoglycerate dehydrogenase-like enzyme [Spelaeicoccus albus]